MNLIVGNKYIDCNENIVEIIYEGYTELEPFLGIVRDGSREITLCTRTYSRKGEASTPLRDLIKEYIPERIVSISVSARSLELLRGAILTDLSQWTKTAKTEIALLNDFLDQLPETMDAD